MSVNESELRRRHTTFEIARILTPLFAIALWIATAPLESRLKVSGEFEAGYVSFLVIGTALVWRMFDRRYKAATIDCRDFAMKVALESVREVHNELLYSGLESKVFKTLEVQNLTKRFYVVQLCRTKSGSWFKLRSSMEIGATRPYGIVAEPASIEEVKRIFAGEPETYQELFGAPKLA